MDVYGRYIYIFISLMDSNGVTGCERHKLITIVWHNIVAAKARTSIRLQFFFILPLGLPWGDPDGRTTLGYMVQRCFMFTKFGLLVISSALGGRSEKFIASFADHAQSREPSYESKSTVKPFAVLQDTASKKPTPVTI